MVWACKRNCVTTFEPAVRILSLVIIRAARFILTFGRLNRLSANSNWKQKIICSIRPGSEEPSLDFQNNSCDSGIFFFFRADGYKDVNYLKTWVSERSVQCFHFALIVFNAQAFITFLLPFILKRNAKAEVTWCLLSTDIQDASAGVCLCALTLMIILRNMLLCVHWANWWGTIERTSGWPHRDHKIVYEAFWYGTKNDDETQENNLGIAPK